ncbi:MAG: CHAT domain-containing protein [Oscillatoria princeps RMCB-10]|jgi:hypothetical protein|nr:CHAT domain-containing protein [Oscillatoria princeps RMCB-10]
MGKKLVILNLPIGGNFTLGFPVLLRIREDGDPQVDLFQCDGQLPGASQLYNTLNEWLQVYRQLVKGRNSGRLQSQGVTSISIVNDRAKTLSQELKDWLRSGNTDWQTVRDRLQQHLQPKDEIRAIIQTQNSDLWRLPWPVWDLFNLGNYERAEIALSFPEVRPLDVTFRGEKQSQIRILAVFGNSNNIDTQFDEKVIKSLEQRGAVITTLPQPNLKDLFDALWDARGWDILCFAGHSSSQDDGQDGWLFINELQRLGMNEAKHAMKAAIERGLQLAIFNSCDGLGIAYQLAQLQLPQSIVMREPVPDSVAKDFLEYFFLEFAKNGQSLYASVREARRQLERWDRHLLGASWLPVICQNTAVMPPTWEELRRRRSEPGTVTAGGSGQPGTVTAGGVMFEQFWQNTGAGFLQLLAELRNRRDTEDADLKGAVEEIVQACRNLVNALENNRRESKVPSVEDISERFNHERDWQTVYGFYLKELRSEIEGRLQSMDGVLNQSTDRVKSAVTDVLVGAGLGRLTEARGPEFLEFMVTSVPDDLQQLKRGFPELSGFKMSYKFNFDYRIRPHLDSLTLNSAPVQISTFYNAGEIHQCLKIALRKTLYDCQEPLQEFYCEPNQIALALVERFVDRVFRAEGVRDEWQIFWENL